MDQIECESRIDRVVVYARGAVVTRTVSLPASLPEGAVELRIAGITALAEAGSVRALAEGEREVTAVKAQVRIPAAPARPGRLREKQRALELEHQRLTEAQGLAERQKSELAGVMPTPHFPRWERNADPAARFQHALALGGLVAEEVAALDLKLRGLREAIEDNERRAAAAQLDAAQGTSADLEGSARPELGVEVRLGAAGALASLTIDYVVTAARWWPAYTARLSAAATRVVFGLDAFVAQASGEAWSGVALAVSTADLARDVRLPELRSLRIGRAQPPRRLGYRAPPAGLEAMFEGHDRAVKALPRRREEVATRGAVREEQDEGRLADDEAGDRLYSLDALASAPGSYGGGPQGMPSPRPQAVAMKARLAKPMAAMPMAAMEMTRSASASAKGASHSALSLGAESPSGSATRAPAEPEAPAAIEPDEAWLDFDALTLADPEAPEGRGQRGRLAREPSGKIGSQIAAAQAAIDRLGPPSEAEDPRVTRGQFDHRYDAEGKADVPSSGRPHRVAIGSAEGEARPRFVAVPREAAEVYREAEIPNPFAAPLLAGPVEVFLDGALLATSRVDRVDRGGRLHLGLGVEERLRVARNARVEEGSAGLLGGSTTVDHHVTIDVASSLGHAVEIDVLDRIPVTSDKDIEIKLVASKPSATKITQAERGEPVRGGLSWHIKVSPGEKQRIEVTYRVTLPAKNEIVGGNRRE